MKTSLICEGGGTRAAYTAGVLEAFAQENLNFDYYVAVSSGAVALTNHLTNNHQLNKVLFTEIITEKNTVGLNALLHEGQIYGVNYLLKRINDYGGFKFNNLTANLEIALCNYTKRRLEYFNQIDDTVLKTACSLFLLTRMVKINGDYYTDAGIMEMIAINRALELNCDFNVIILTKEKEFKRKAIPFYQRILSLIFHRDLFGYRCLKNRHLEYQREMELIEQLESEGKALVIRPSKNLEMSRSSNDKNQLIKAYQLGIEDGKRESLRILKKIRV